MRVAVGEHQVEPGGRHLLDRSSTTASSAARRRARPRRAGRATSANSTSVSARALDAGDARSLEPAAQLVPDAVAEAVDHAVVGEEPRPGGERGVPVSSTGDGGVALRTAASTVADATTPARLANDRRSTSGRACGSGRARAGRSGRTSRRRTRRRSPRRGAGGAGAHDWRSSECAGASSSASRVTGGPRYARWRHTAQRVPRAAEAGEDLPADRVVPVAERGAHGARVRRPRAAPQHLVVRAEEHLGVLAVGEGTEAGVRR